MASYVQMHAHGIHACRFLSAVLCGTATELGTGCTIWVEVPADMFCCLEQMHHTYMR